MESLPTTATKIYCNQLAIEKGLDPVGHAGSFTTTMVIEVPLPWKTNMYSEAGVLPQVVIDLYALWLERYRAGLGYPNSILMVASDPTYSRQGFRRVMHYARPADSFATYRKAEYSVPDDQFGALIWALAEAPDLLTQFEPYRDAANDSTREILVCTHGSVDVACAKFGYPLYKYLRKNHASDAVRVWRVSHFGGHIFAPTMVDMPHGHYWAYVEQEQADQIIKRTGDPRSLYKHYRGWAGLGNSFLQAAERELWMAYGWKWFDMPKSGTVLPGDVQAEEPDFASVRLDYILPAETQTHSYTAQVDVQQRISTPYSTASTENYAYQQYVVTGSQFT